MDAVKIVSTLDSYGTIRYLSLHYTRDEATLQSHATDDEHIKYKTKQVN